MIGSRIRLPWDEAITTLAAVTRVGTDSSIVREWVDRARSTLQELGARPALALLDNTVASASGSGAAGDEADVVVAVEGSTSSPQIPVA